VTTRAEQPQDRTASLSVRRRQLLATLHGGQQYLVEAKARGVDAPPQQTRKNVELLMEHRGEYGLVWAINESASEVKAFIKYVSKRHTALADVSRQGRFRRKHTENEYGLILFEKVTVQSRTATSSGT
jgi:hypothetical protein